MPKHGTCQEDHRDSGQGGDALWRTQGDLPQHMRPGSAPGEEDQGGQELSDNVMIMPMSQ